jgi:hypothetical protein
MLTSWRAAYRTRSAAAPARWWCAAPRRSFPSSTLTHPHRGLRLAASSFAANRGGGGPTASPWPDAFLFPSYRPPRHDSAAANLAAANLAGTLGVPNLLPLHCMTSSYSTTSGRGRRASASSDYYAILGLPPRNMGQKITSEQIKRAYFERARKCHPDLHPGDSEATAKFQGLSHAYSVLKDPAARDQYDRTGADPGPHGSGGGYGGAAGFDDWEREWQQVWSEFGFDQYLKEVKEEGQDAVEAIRLQNDWHPAQLFVSKHRVLVLGVLLPLAVSLRFPALIWGGLRVATSIATFVFFQLPEFQQRRILQNVWGVMVAANKKYSPPKR